MKRIEFIGVRAGHGTTTVALAAAATLATRGPTRLATHERRSLCAMVGITDDWPPIRLGDNLEVVDGPGGDVFDAGTLEQYLDEEPFPDFGRKRRDSTSGPLRIVVLRGPDYLGVRTLCAHPDAQLDGVVVVNEAGRALDARDVEHVCGRPVVAVIDHTPVVARTLDAGLFLSRVDRLGEFTQLRTWIAQHAPEEASCAAS